MEDWAALESSIRRHVHERVGADGTPAVDDETELIDSKLLTSMLLINLIVEIEREVGVRLVDDDVSLSDFSSISSMLRVAREALARSSRPQEALR